MKRKTKLLTVLLITLSCIFAALMLAGCSGGENSADITPLVGTWVRTESTMEFTYVFKSDNTYTLHSETTKGANPHDEKGTFTYNGKTLKLINDKDHDHDVVFNVSFSESTMYWDNGYLTFEYNKK